MDDALFDAVFDPTADRVAEEPARGSDAAAAEADDGAPFAASSVLDATFAGRVAVLMRSRPIADALSAAGYQGIPEETYDIATLALAAIDQVISRQGFEEEATYDEVAEFLTRLAATAAPNRPEAEHGKVAEFTLNYLLNRPGHGTRFNYKISDYTAEGHQWRNVGFWLVQEHEDPLRGVPVLVATRDAINALVGGLEFDVEDEQIANEAMLEKQLARGAFDAAEKSALKHTKLSVAYADAITQILKDTRRDIRAVMDTWVTEMPQRLDAARSHIGERLETESRLLTKARESLEAEDPKVTRAAARIANLLEQGRRRHEALHHRVITAREVFLTEQDRQTFRPPAATPLVDVPGELLDPTLRLTLDPALSMTGQWLITVSGPVPPRLPRLYRLINDLWTLREPAPEEGEPLAEEEVGDPDPPVVAPHVREAVVRLAHQIGLPARLSTLLAACLTDDTLPTDDDRQQAADLMMLAVLWFYAPDTDEDDDGPQISVELAAELFGPRAVTDTDTTPLRLPGWTGEDLIVAAYPDQLEDLDALPDPVTDLPDDLRRTA